jgi:hypothetical protein
MTAEPLDTGKYGERLDALRSYVDAREAETTSRTADTVAAADAAYERYAALRDQGGPAPDHVAEPHRGGATPWRSHTGTS